MPSRRDAAKATLDWVAASGGEVAALSIHTGEDGELEVRARRAIPAGEVVMRIPRRCMIATGDAAGSPLGRRLVREGVKLRHGHSRLAAFVAAEARDAASPWRPFLRALPADFAHHPLFFGREELRLLRGTRLPAELRRFRATLATDLETLHAAAPPLRKVTLRDFTWARLVLSTRAYGLTVEDRQGRALIPVADLMNHAAASDVAGVYEAESEEFIVRAVRDLAAGAEIRSSYGIRCNGKLLLGYGFCQEENPANEVVLPLGAPAPAGAPTELVVSAASAPLDALLSTLRRACATPRERALPGLADAAVGDGPVPPVGSRNERAALHALAALAEGALRRYETTLAEDDALLAAPLPRTHRACILLRRGEKRVLQDLIDLSRAALPFLRLGASDFRRAVRDQGSGAFVSRYLASLGHRTPRSLEDLFSADF